MPTAQAIVGPVFGPRILARSRIDNQGFALLEQNERPRIRMGVIPREAGFHGKKGASLSQEERMVAQPMCG